MILYYILVTFSSQVSHTGKNAFSLDGAKTKFPSLEHLVDFHKMNSGPLPTILQESALGPRLERIGEERIVLMISLFQAGPGTLRPGTGA